MKHLIRHFRARKSLPLLIGLSVALAGCSEGTAQSVSTVVFGEADELFIQPIQVCDDNGNSCAGVNLFADITRKILEQAQLKVSFLPTNRLNASRFLTIQDNSDRNSADYEFYELTRTGGSGAFGRNPDSTDTSGPINVWFVEEIESDNGFTQYGLAWVDANGVLVSEDSRTFDGGKGRPDTLAHELGHNLGLRHSSSNGNRNNLLADGNIRNLPNSANDVGLNGAGVSLLTAAQIKEILNSPFVNRDNPGIIGQEIEEADHTHVHTHPHPHIHTHPHPQPHTHTPTHTQTYPHLSADEATALLTRLAVLGELDGIDPTLITQADIALLRSRAGAAKSVPEPLSVMPLGVLVLLLLGMSRHLSRPLADVSAVADQTEF